jgi:hypothetical protein
VHLVKHQVVLSDYVSPLSSLTAAISVPIRRSSSWRKSTTTNDNTSLDSYFDDDEEVKSSPRTSIGSEENSSNGFLKVDDSADKRKTGSSLSSFISSYKKEGNNIIFESKYTTPSSPAPSSTLEKAKNPFWMYTQGDEKEYDRQLRQVIV